MPETGSSDYMITFTGLFVTVIKSLMLALCDKVKSYIYETDDQIQNSMYEV